MSDPTVTRTGRESSDGDNEQDKVAEDDRRYLVPGTDSKGHYERIWCRLMPGHLLAVRAIVKGRRFPFRSEGDLLRWCLDYGVRELTRRAGSGPSVMRQVDIVMELLRDELWHQEYAETFAKLQEAVQRYIAEGALGEARRIVAFTRQQFELMPEGYWREQYLRKWAQQFGYLLEAQEGEGAQLL